MKMTLALTAIMMCVASTAFAADKMTSEKMDPEAMMAAQAMEKKDAMMAPEKEAMEKNAEAMDRMSKMKSQKDRM